jgi:hypothetical protein
MSAAWARALVTAVARRECTQTPCTTHFTDDKADYQA